MNEPDYADAVRAWAAHLRGGGTTPWRRWLRGYAAPSGGATAERTGPVPGAAELEFVRRIALAAGDGRDALGWVADLALGRTPPGRGPARIPLWWPHGQPPTLGVSASDPSRLAREELLRVGTGVLAELLLRCPPPPATPAAPGRRRPWTPAFRVAGAPVTAADLRAHLTAAGRVEGGRRPRVLVVAAPLDIQLGEAWSARVQRGTPVRWPGFVARWSVRDRLPPSADTARLAELWARRVGAARVHVLVRGPQDGPALRRTAGGLLGARLPDHRDPGVPQPLDATALDLLRRLNRVLGIRTGADGHARLLAGLVPMLGTGHEVQPPPLPQRYADWARRRGAAIADRLAEAGYAVHGDLAALATCRSSRRPEPPRAEVLDRLTAVCLELAAAAERTRTSGEGRDR